VNLSGRCVCKDPEDDRISFYECSNLNQAVVEILLSSSTPTMAINFGKPLLDLNGFPANTNSPAVCAAVFSPASINLLSPLSSCTISGKWLNVTLGKQKWPNFYQSPYEIRLFFKILLSNNLFNRFFLYLIRWWYSNIPTKRLDLCNNSAKFNRHIPQ